MITYNHENFIQEAIEGVLMQVTSFKYQLIIGEDFSTDETWSICNQYAQKYPDIIKLLPSAKNLGMMPNFIRTIEACKSKYIALCEGDDYWTDPNKLQRQVDFFDKNTDYSICFHPVKIKQNNSIIADNITREVSTDTSFDDLVFGNYIHTPSVMYRGTVTLPNWLSSVMLGDYSFHLLYAKLGKVKKLTDPMAIYRLHDGGVFSNHRSWTGKKKLNHRRSQIHLFQTFADHFKEKEFHKKAIMAKTKLRDEFKNQGLDKEQVSLEKEILRNNIGYLNIKQLISYIESIIRNSFRFPTK